MTINIHNTIPRLLFIIPLGLFGVMHFVFPSFFTHMVPAYLSSQYFWVYFSGMALTLASLTIGLKIYPVVSSVLLILFILIFISAVDIPGVIDVNTRYYRMVSLFKDISLLGGTLTYLLLFTSSSKP